METFFLLGPAVAGFALTWATRRLWRIRGWPEPRAEAGFVLAFFLGGLATAGLWLVAQPLGVNWLAWQVDALARNVGLPLGTRTDLRVFVLGYGLVLQLQLFVLGYHFVLGGTGGALADRILALSSRPATVGEPATIHETGSFEPAAAAREVKAAMATVPPMSPLARRAVVKRHGGRRGRVRGAVRRLIAPAPAY